MKAQLFIIVILIVAAGLTACEKTDTIIIVRFPDLPAVVTYGAENITSHTAYLSGSIENSGGWDIIESGINIYVSGCITMPGPCQLPGFKEWRFSDNNSIGHFSVFLRDLKPNTTYHYRAFARNENGTSFGEMQILVTPEEISFQ